jgi:sensor histidine kinase YesM
MQWHEFVFSEKKEKRLLRHIVFWLLWWLYFSFCDYLFQQPVRGLKENPVYVITGAHILLKTLLLVSVYTTANYVFMNLVLAPAIKAQWQKVVISFLLLCICLFITGHLMYWYVFPSVDALFKHYRPNHFATWFWPAVYLGLINPIKIIAAAAIIKYVKYWWLKQKESERLEREKIDTELRLLKAQVHPDFLLNTLNSIYNHALSCSPQAPAMLLKLSDLLSYMLYECEDSLVPLEREISMMKEYMEIERMRQSGKPEVEITVKGNVKSK